MAPEVFFTVCYGTCNVPEAIRKLKDFKPAVLHGYRRQRVRHADYPGMLAEAGHSVHGMLVSGLTNLDMMRLDAFEGSEYRIEDVKVRPVQTKTSQDGTDAVVEDDEVEAATYIFIYPDDLEGDWSYENFRKNKLALWSRNI